MGFVEYIERASRKTSSLVRIYLLPEVAAGLPDRPALCCLHGAALGSNSGGLRMEAAAERPGRPGPEGPRPTQAKLGFVACSGEADESRWHAGADRTGGHKFGSGMPGSENRAHFTCGLSSCCVSGKSSARAGGKACEVLDSFRLLGSMFIAAVTSGDNGLFAAKMSDRDVGSILSPGGKSDAESSTFFLSICGSEIGRAHV